MHGTGSADCEGLLDNQIRDRMHDRGGRMIGALVGFLEEDSLSFGPESDLLLKSHKFCTLDRTTIV